MSQASNPIGRVEAFFRDRALSLDGRTLDAATVGGVGGLVETFPPPGPDALSGESVPLLRAGDVELHVSTRAPHLVHTPDGQSLCALAELDAVLLPKLRHIGRYAEQGRELVKQDAYEEAEAVLAPIWRLIELSYVEHSTWQAHTLAKHRAGVANLLGICFRHSDRSQRAEQLWLGVLEESGAARLNLADLYAETRRDGDLEALTKVRVPYDAADRRADRNYVFVRCALAAEARDDRPAAERWRARIEGELGPRERALLDGDD